MGEEVLNKDEISPGADAPTEEKSAPEEKTIESGPSGGPSGNAEAPTAESPDHVISVEDEVISLRKAVSTLLRQVGGLQEQFGQLRKKEVAAAVVAPVAAEPVGMDAIFRELAGVVGLLLENAAMPGADKIKLATTAMARVKAALKG